MKLKDIMGCMYEEENVRIEYPIGFGCYTYKDFYTKKTIKEYIKANRNDFSVNDDVRDIWVGDDGALTITLKDSFGGVR